MEALNNASPLNIIIPLSGKNKPYGFVTASGFIPSVKLPLYTPYTTSPVKLYLYEGDSLSVPI